MAMGLRSFILSCEVYFLNIMFQIGPRYECQLIKESSISNQGGTIIIEDVELCIPPNALQENTEHCLVQMRIIPRSLVAEPAQTFASNSSVIVELLPNNLSLRVPAKLTLPHCLQLKKGIPRKATVFISHHEIGKKASIVNCCPHVRRYGCDRS